MVRPLSNTTIQQWAIFPLRLIVGFGFIAHGAAKWMRGPENFAKLLHLIGTPLPFAAAWSVTVLELFGGLAVLAGVFVAIVSVPLIASMLVAMFAVHLRFGFSTVNTIGLTTSGPIFGPPGYEINLLYIAALFLLLAAGPGEFSVEGWLARHRYRPAPLAGERP